MKKSFKFLPQGGFTLMEVMVAISILAISLVSLLSVQGGSIALAGRTKYLTVATLLARSKMVDVEMELFKEGFSEFGEEMEGDFSEEGWPQFKWHADITKVKIPLPSSMPTTGEDGQQNAYAGMMSGYASFITDMISNALRECTLEIMWMEGKEEQSFTVSTHFVEYARSMPTEVPVGGVGSLNKVGGLKNNSSGSTSGTIKGSSTKGNFTTGSSNRLGSTTTR